MKCKKRERLHNIFDKLKDLSIELPPKPKNGDLHSWHLFIIQLKNSKVSRNDLINKLFENGIGCSVHYIPLHLHPYWRDKYKLSKENFPVSKKIYENSISLPIYSMMTEKDTQRVIVELKKYI